MIMHLCIDKPTYILMQFHLLVAIESFVVTTCLSPDLISRCSIVSRGQAFSPRRLSIGDYNLQSISAWAKRVWPRETRCSMSVSYACMSTETSLA